MKKYRYELNIILLSILILITGILIIKVVFTNSAFAIRHYFGIAFTLITLAALFFNKNVFFVTLLVTLLIGNFYGLSSLHTIITYRLGFNIGGLSIPLYWGQPFYSLLLLVYLIVNKEFYVGVVTKRYWQGFMTRTEDLEKEIIVINADTKANGNSGSEK